MNARGKCCAKCAFRVGSQERSDPWKWLFLVEGWEKKGSSFICHETVPDHPQSTGLFPEPMVCAGFTATRATPWRKMMRLAEQSETAGAS